MAGVLRLLVLVALLTVQQTLAAADQVREQQASDVFKAKALAVLRQKFPDAAFVDEGNGSLVFALKTREFTLYRADKTGAWQQARQETGPDQGGFVVRFSLHDSPWEGALDIPHAGTQDFYVFQETLVVKASTDKKQHMWAEVLNPRFKGNAELRDQLVQLFSSFEGF